MLEDSIYCNEEQLELIEKLQNLLKNETKPWIMHSCSRPTTFINSLPVAVSLTENTLKKKKIREDYSPDSSSSGEESKVS
jgi:chaperone required for assembly of F1-ATPase